MAQLNSPLRNTFLAGIFAAIPLAVTIFVVWYVEHVTRLATHAVLGVNVPFLGVLLALASIYLLGLIVSSIIGRYFLLAIDWLLLRVPVMRELYRAWKQITLTPGGREGTWSKVVLVPVDGQTTMMLGFTSGDPIAGDPQTCCVYVPSSPNPVNGRLYFVRRDRCVLVDMTTEEAFKVILSLANYTPQQLGAATRAALT